MHQISVLLQSNGFFFIFFYFCVSLLVFSCVLFLFYGMQLREYIDDTEDYINIQVNS